MAKITSLSGSAVRPRQANMGAPSTAVVPRKAPAIPAADATALRDEIVLRRVRRLGSAHDGLREWQLQRKTAVALIPLGLYFVVSMVRLAVSDQLTAARWLSSPVPNLLTILFVAALLAHALVGLRSVLLDYVHTRTRLVAALLLAHGAVILLAGASVLAILKIYLTR